MDGTLQESGGEETGSSPMLTAPESKWLQNTKPGLDPRTTTSSGGSKIYIWWQHLAAFLANLPSLVTGMSLGWTAPAVPILLGQVEDAQPLRLSLEQASWVGGLMPLASLGGALVAGPLAERVGRKGALLLGALPTLVGWLLMAFAGPSVWLLMLGRALTGLAVGAASGPVSLYREEIADIRVRGALGSLHFAMQCVGLLVVYTLGASLPYFWFTVSAAILPVVFVFSFCWMPESPAYLAACGRVSDAQQALRWLRGPDVDFRAEVENVLASRSQAHVFSNTRSLSYICSQRPLQSNSIRAVFLILVLMFLQQMSGIGMFTFYLVQFFEQSGGNVSSTLSSVLTGLAFVVGSIGATATVDRIGRRFLLVMSSIIMCISLSTLVLFAHLNSNNLNIEGSPSCINVNIHYCFYCRSGAYTLVFDCGNVTNVFEKLGESNSGLYE